MLTTIALALLAQQPPVGWRNSAYLTPTATPKSALQPPPPATSTTLAAAAQTAASVFSFSSGACLRPCGSKICLIYFNKKSCSQSADEFGCDCTRCCLDQLPVSAISSVVPSPPPPRPPPPAAPVPAAQLACAQECGPATTCADWFIELPCARIQKMLRCYCDPCCLQAIPTELPQPQPTPKPQPKPQPQPQPQLAQAVPAPAAATRAGGSGLPLGWKAPSSGGRSNGHQGACADANGGAGSYREVWGLTEELQCRERCYMDTGCQAYEWAMLATYTRCEIHQDPVHNTFPLPGYVCVVKDKSSAGAALPASIATSIAMSTATPGFLAVASAPAAAPGSTSASASSTPLRTSPALVGKKPAGCCVNSPCIGLVAPGASFTTCVDLAFSDLRGIDLTGANMMNVDLSGSWLDGAMLRAADLSDSIAYRASFVGADLSEAKMNGIDLSESDFRGALLPHADLTGASFSLTNFERATMTNAMLPEAVLSQTIFRQADMSGVDLQKCDATAADFSGANLAGADASTAVFRNANLKHCKIDHAVFAQADVSGADFTGSTGFATADFSWVIGAPKGITRQTVPGFGLQTALSG